jgi:hypothetical protein
LFAAFRPRLYLGRNLIDLLHPYLRSYLRDGFVPRVIAAVKIPHSKERNYENSSAAFVFLNLVPN